MDDETRSLVTFFQGIEWFERNWLKSQAKVVNEETIQITTKQILKMEPSHLPVDPKRGPK